MEPHFQWSTTGLVSTLEHQYGPNHHVYSAYVTPAIVGPTRRAEDVGIGRIDGYRGAVLSGSPHVPPETHKVEWAYRMSFPTLEYAQNYLETIVAQRCHCDGCDLYRAGVHPTQQEETPREH